MPETSPPLLVFLIDAFRHDFVTTETTPQIAALAADGVQRPLRPILGYSDAIRATVFTGRYPDETGYWMEYCFRPQSSPWTGLERLAWIDKLPLGLAVRGAKMVTSRTAMRALAKRRGVSSLDLRNMPLKAADRFDLTLHQPMTAPHALGYSSIFDDCMAIGRPWAYLDASRTRHPGDLLAKVDRLCDDIGLIFVYLHQIDMAAHLFGLASKLFWRRVSFTDALLGRILSKVQSRFGDVEPVIFSDHGMSVLRRQIGIQDLLAHPGFPDRFFVALDATMVRLWFFDDDQALRSEILDRVADRYPGRFLNTSDLATYHLEFADRLYGDEIFLVEPGTGIFPNFHSYIRPKAMHAYEPTDLDQWGIFVGPAWAGDIVSDPVDLTEVTGLVRKMLAQLSPGP